MRDNQNASKNKVNTELRERMWAWKEQIIFWLSFFFFTKVIKSFLLKTIALFDPSIGKSQFYKSAACVRLCTGTTKNRQIKQKRLHIFEWYSKCQSFYLVSNKSQCCGTAGTRQNMWFVSEACTRYDQSSGNIW